MDSVEWCEETVKALSVKFHTNLLVYAQIVDDRPTHLGDLLLKYEIENFEVIDHMTVWQINLCWLIKLQTGIYLANLHVETQPFQDLHLRSNNNILPYTCQHL